MSALTSPPGTIVRPSDGEVVEFLGLSTRTIIHGSQTGGRYAVSEHVLAPRTLGAELHVHEREDEVSTILEGTITVQLGDEIFTAGPGDVVVKPANQWHAFWNAGDEPLRFVELFTPAGFEDFFADAEPFLRDAANIDEQALVAVGERYGLRFDLESAVAIMERHGLQMPA